LLPDQDFYRNLIFRNQGDPPVRARAVEDNDR